MKNIKKKYWLVLAGISVLLILPTILNILHFLPQQTLINIRAHSAIEAIGGVLSILIVVLLYSRFHTDKNELELSFVALAFLGMGVFDLFHSFQKTGNSFVFSHVFSVFNGGFWFGFLALPKKFRYNFRKPLWFRFIIIFWILILLWLIFFDEYLPNMLKSNGEFALVTDIINALAGIGFFVGVYKLLQRFGRTNETEVFFIAIIGLLQGFSRLTFHWSYLWDIDWWIWHSLRLAGSFIVFLMVLRLYNSLLSELRQKNQTQQTILDTMPFGVMLVNQNKQIIQMNQAGYELTGFTENEIKNKTCFQSVCTAGCDNCPVLDQNTLFQNAEKLLAKKDGTLIPILKSVVPIEINGEKIILEGFIDISEQQKAKKELELNEQKFRDIFDSVTNSIFIFDLEKGIVDVNKTAEKQYGYTKEEFKKLSPEKLIHPDYLHEFKRFTNELKEKGSFTGQTVDVKKDGTTFYTDVSGTIVKINNRAHMLAAIRDISAIKKAEQELYNTLNDLRRSNRELEQFAYVSSHDLQEPLRKIKNFSDLLVFRSKDKLDEKSLRFVEIISSSAVRMQELINNLLLLSRISDKPEITEINLENLLENIRKTLKLKFHDTTFDIVAKDLPLIKAGKKEMEILFTQIISNSIKFRSGESPKINITCVSDKNYWEFKISDNGIGFEMQFAEKIFTVFQRLHPRDKYPGTGIGLTLCKKIVEQHSGNITAASEPEKGTAITFSIKKLN